MGTALVSPRVGTVRTGPIWRVSCKSQSHRKTLTFTTRPPPPPRLLSPRAHLCGHSWLELVSPTPSPRPSEARRRASNRHWEAGSGEYLPPIPGTSPAFYELPMSSEADTGAGRGGDLREVWEPHPKGNCQPSSDRREGSPGRDALYPLFTEGPGPHV